MTVVVTKQEFWDRKVDWYVRQSFCKKYDTDGLR